MNFAGFRFQRDRVMDLPGLRVDLRLVCVATASLWLTACAGKRDSGLAGLASGPHPPMPRFMNDPIEPVNRGVFAFNRGLMQGVLQPTAGVYRWVVPKPARSAIDRFRRNAGAPGRVINQSLQGRWSDAGNETQRFLVNTTAGVGGLWDPATKWGLPQHDADFAQTFRRWGWRPDIFVMLPFFGPSDPCHALGTVADEAAEPWNYADAWRAASYLTTFNRLGGNIDEQVRFIRAQADPYAATRMIWSFASRADEPDMRVRGPVDLPTLQTMAVGALRVDDPDFVARGRELRVRMPATGRDLPVNYWLQSGEAPMVWVVPGLGSHRLTMSALVVAEHLHRRGFSVAVMSSTFHPEFMERASTAALPAHMESDGRDLLTAVGEADRTIDRKHPGRLGKRALVGCSMAGYQAMLLAATERSQGDAPIAIERYVAINPPIDLHDGIERIDALIDAPLAWPEDQRQQRIDNALHKIRGLAGLPNHRFEAPPFEAIESKYLIGLYFRLTLRDTLYSCLSRHEFGALNHRLARWNRTQVHDELMAVSLRDYYERIAIPHYEGRGVSRTELWRHANLRHFTTGLISNSKARMITNRNDILLDADDLRWIGSTFGKHRASMFDQGGHLGNLGTPALLDAVVSHLDGLK
jgi:ABC-type transporter lipoprotein component MlaA